MKQQLLKQSIRADAAAPALVTRLPAELQRCGGTMCPPGACDHHDAPTLGRFAAGPRPGGVPASVGRVIASPGQPLTPAVRASMESRLGHDFGQVRIHADAEAAGSARAVDALAYTVGSHIAFDADRFAPDTAAGRGLLIHELAHVVQQRAGPAPPGPAELTMSEPDDAAEVEASQLAHDALPAAGQGPALAARSLQRQRRQRRRSEPSAESAAEFARDYTDAQNYVTDFYSTAARIQDDLAEAAHRSINKFTEVTGIPDSRLGANIAYQAIRIVLGILPGASSVIGIFDAVSRGLALATSGARLATMAGVVSQRAAAGVFTAQNAPGAGTRPAAIEALDTLSRFDTEGAARIERERAEARDRVAQIGRTSSRLAIFREIAGVSLLSEVRTDLGPLPVYDAATIQRFEQEYELRLYREYYVRNAWIDHRPPSFFGRPYTSYVINQVPGATRRRILSLHRLLGHTAQVSIDPRWAGEDIDAVEIVKVLLDWGVPLYWWRRGDPSDTPEVLHTGSDLNQPYRGERFREVN
jgi:hypothetical protein